MTFVYNLSIKYKLLSSFMFIIIINTCILLSSIYALNNNRNAADTIDEILSQAYIRISNTQNAIIETHQYYLLGINPDIKEITYQDVLRDGPALHNKVLNFASQIRPDYMGDAEYEKICIQQRDNARKMIETINEYILPLVRQNKLAEAYRLYGVKIVPIVDQAIRGGAEAMRYQTRAVVAQARPASDLTPIYIDLGFAVFGLVSALFMAIAMSNYMSQAIAEQNKILLTIADGDFSQHISDGYKDEFGQARSVLRQMRNSLNDILNMTKNACDSLQKEMLNLKQASQEISETANDLQSKSIAVAAATNEMVSTTAEIARNCENAASGSNSCQESTAKSLSMVNKSVENIRQQSAHTRDNAAKIDNLARQSREIGSIVSTIDDIAAQTNLLALNAAIEAARAGNAGRGFAVVADEVRALASRTSSSTQEISRMVKSIQDEAAVATESINASVTNMETVAQDALAIEDMLNNVTNQVSEVSGQITQIATAAEEQTTATSEISNNVQMTTDGTEDVSNRANKQCETMIKAYNDLEELRKSLAFFKTRPE